MPHQQHIVDVGLEIDPSTGFLAYENVIVIAPRQVSGKSELLLPLMTHRCTGFTDTTPVRLSDWVRAELGIVVPEPGPQTVLYTAQDSDEARKKWRDVHVARLKKSSYYRPRRQFHVRLQRQFETITWGNGSTWSPAATTGSKSGTGDTIDLGVIDEAWSRRDSSVELGMRPAMMTRPWRQFWLASMIPGLVRRGPDEWPYLKEKRRAARELLEAGVRYGTALFDFTAPEGSDPGDPETWYTCMPGLGRTVREATVAADFRDLPLIDFCAEYLGWEPKEKVPMWTTIPQRIWEEDLYDVESQPVGAVAMAAEMDKDRRRGWLGIVGKRADGHWHVEVVEPGLKVAAGTVGVDWMERRALEILGSQSVCTTVIDKRRPASSLIVPLQNAGYDVTTPNGLDIQAACGRLYDRTGARADPEHDDGTRIRHLGQESLDRAVAVVQKIDVGAGAFTFVNRGSSDEIGPLYLMVLGMLGVELKWTPPVPEPWIFY